MLCCGRRLAAGEAGLAQAEGERHDQQRRRAEHEERVLPAEAADQAVLHRHHQELAERAGRGGDAHRPGRFSGAMLRPITP